MNNVYLEKIKRYLKEASNYFDPQKSSYQTLMRAINSNNASEMLDELDKLGLMKDYPENLQNFFSETYKMLEALEKQEKQINQNNDQIKEKGQEVKEELSKRNIDYNLEYGIEKQLDKMSYVEKQDYIAKQEKQLENIELALEKGIRQEKTSGDEFDERIYNLTTPEALSNDKGEVRKINEDARNNKLYLLNPDSENVLTIIGDLRGTQTNDSKLNIKIDYENSKMVTLQIGYKGTQVDESKPLYNCVYSDPSYFKAFILPELLEQHLIDEPNKFQENGSLMSENSEGETLEVTGNENEVNSVSNEIDSCVDDYNIEKSMRMNKKNVRVRLDENIYKSAASLSVTIYVIILIAAILILIVSLLILKIK